MSMMMTIRRMNLQEKQVPLLASAVLPEMHSLKVRSVSSLFILPKSICISKKALSEFLSIKNKRILNVEAERNVLGAENTSKSWRNLILQAGGVVASAAKDAAVEFSTLQSDPHPADAYGDASTGGSTERSSSTRVGKMRATRRRTTSPLVRSEAGDSASTASTRRRPKASRTSSRASSRV
jgi:cell division protein FtsL